MSPFCTTPATSKSSVPSPRVGGCAGVYTCIVCKDIYGTSTSLFVCFFKFVLIFVYIHPPTHTNDDPPPQEKLTLQESNSRHKLN